MGREDPGVCEKIEAVIYTIKNGLKVCEEGAVIIEGVEHYVKGGFVTCNSTLSSKAWNTTLKEKERLKCALMKPRGNQLKLF